jgi:hypothetical protein
MPQGRSTERRKIKENIAEKTKERWHGKRMHGQLPRNLYESWWILNSCIVDYNLATLREKQKIQ